MTALSRKAVSPFCGNHSDLEIIPTTWLLEELDAFEIRPEEVEMHRQIFEIRRGNVPVLDGTNPWVDAGYRPPAPAGYEWVLLHRWGARSCSSKKCVLAHCVRKRARR